MGNTIAIPERRRSSKSAAMHSAATEVATKTKKGRKSHKSKKKHHDRHHHHHDHDANSPSMEFNNATSDGTMTDQDRVRMALMGDPSDMSFSGNNKAKRRVSSAEFRKSATHMDPQDVIAQLEMFANQEEDASDYLTTLKGIK